MPHPARCAAQAALLRAHSWAGPPQHPPQTAPPQAAPAQAALPQPGRPATPGCVRAGGGACAHRLLHHLLALLQQLHLLHSHHPVQVQRHLDLRGAARRGAGGHGRMGRRGENRARGWRWVGGGRVRGSWPGSPSWVASGGAGACLHFPLAVGAGQASACKRVCLLGGARARAGMWAARRKGRRIGRRIGRRVSCALTLSLALSAPAGTLKGPMWKAPAWVRTQGRGQHRRGAASGEAALSSGTVASTQHGIAPHCCSTQSAPTLSERGECQLATPRRHSPAHSSQPLFAATAPPTAAASCCDRPAHGWQLPRPQLAAPAASSLPTAGTPCRCRPAPRTDVLGGGGGDVRVLRVVGAEAEGLGAVEGQHLGRGHVAAAVKDCGAGAGGRSAGSGRGGAGRPAESCPCGAAAERPEGRPLAWPPEATADALLQTIITRASPGPAWPSPGVRAFSRLPPALPRRCPSPPAPPSPMEVTGGWPCSAAGQVKLMP